MLNANDTMLGSVYILVAVMLVLGSLMARREPVAKLITIALAWVAIFGAGFVIFTFRDDLGYFAARLKAEAFGTAIAEGSETRIPMAIDGHFWVNAKVNGHDVKFLVDSGATMTTIDRQTAAATGVKVATKADQMVRTGNGVIRVSSGRADMIAVGPIVREDVAIQVADHDDLNVLGMNYLSTLKQWGVSGRWMILVG